MERLIFDEEHEMFRESVRRFMQNEIGPHGERWRAQGCVDREAFEKAGEQGFLMLWADEKYGGAGIEDFRYEQILIEENVHYGETGFFINLHTRLVGPYLGQLGSEEQKQRWLPDCISGKSILAVAMTEAGAGSDISGTRTRAEDKGDHWLLNGSKTYISNGLLADLVVVAARTVPDKPHGMGLFVVERDMPGFSRGKKLEKMGLHAQDTAELFFENVKVPKDNVLGDATKGFYYLMQFLAEERLINACGNIAHAEAAFGLSLDYVKERKAFGQPIGAFQNSRFKLADMRARIDCVQTYVDQCVLQHILGKLTAEEAAKVKLLSSELEGQVMDECVQLHGGAGYMSDYRISRMFTDARVSRIYAGSSEIMREIIARSIGLDERKLRGQ
jgi:alkylation response protein AidB-like acyl-CoA dehydrogenase